MLGSGNPRYRIGLRVPLMLLVVGIVAVLAPLTASASSSKGSADHIKVAMVPRAVGIQVFEVQRNCAKKVAANLNADFEYVAPAEATVDAQIAIVNTLIDRKFNVIMITPNNSEASAPVLQRARAAGIKVITYDQDTLPDARDVYVQDIDNQTIATTHIDELARQLGGKNARAEIAYVSANPDSPAQTRWIALMNKYMKANYPGLKVVATVYGYSNFSKALTASLNLLRAHPNVKGIIAPDALAVPAAAEAVQKLKMKGVAIVGMTNPLSIKPYLLNGTVKTAYIWDFCDEGKMVMSLARALYDGKFPAGSTFKDKKTLTLGYTREPGMGKPVFQIGASDRPTEKNTVIFGPFLKLTAANIKRYNW